VVDVEVLLQYLISLDIAMLVLYAYLRMKLRRLTLQEEPPRMFVIMGNRAVAQFSLDDEELKALLKEIHKEVVSRVWGRHMKPLDEIIRMDLRILEVLLITLNIIIIVLLLSL